MGTLYMSPHIIRESRKMLLAFGESLGEGEVAAEITPSTGLVAVYLAMQVGPEKQRTKSGRIARLCEIHFLSLYPFPFSCGKD